MWRKLPGEGKLYYLLYGTLVIYVLFVRMGILGFRITSFEDTACIFRRYRQSFDMDTEIVTHNGGCHCQKVRWQAQAPTRVVAWECNCSNCSMRMNTHFVVPVERFRLSEDSKQFLTTYTFGTLTAKHTFCKVCGITSFYYPRSNPDGVAITYRCVERGTLTHVEIKQYDGKNWESSYNQSGIASCSKV